MYDDHFFISLSPIAGYLFHVTVIRVTWHLASNFGLNFFFFLVGLAQSFVSYRRPINALKLTLISVTCSLPILLLYAYTNPNLTISKSLSPLQNRSFPA